MRLGVDFGTTRTTVAVVDRGNYPLFAFTDQDDDAHEYLPSIAALDGGELVFGFEASRLALSGAPHIRSFKRSLADPDVTVRSTVRIGDREMPLIDLVTEYLAYVGRSVLASRPGKGEALEAVVGVPAHAHSAQRFLTLEAFRRAGYAVTAMLNEPSAAGFEYTHRHAKTLNSRRTRVLVYDLGGGTFDASLVAVDGKSHEVLASHGNNRLGGDDFDAVLAGCAAQIGGTSREELGRVGWQRLLDAARVAKESLYPQSRFATLEVDGTAIAVPVRRFYEAVAPLVESTFDTLEALMEHGRDGRATIAHDVAGLYVVGGGSELPIVARMLRNRYGRRVHRSPYTAGSTAIGLALAADPEAGYSLADQLSRGVGVFREGESGTLVTFDPLLSPELRVSPGKAVSLTRRYRAAHNLGRYRFVEYTRTEDGVPRGTVVPCGQVSFPFDPALRGAGVDLDGVDVRRTAEGALIEENYTVDAHGIVEVSIRDLDTGYATARSLGARGLGRGE
ncbi:MAG: Hsp70 family protein [Actinomyces sp.]|nr:MAG: Hsp70 family protein [Actinomyces sp.]